MTDKEHHTVLRRIARALEELVMITANEHHVGLPMMIPCPRCGSVLATKNGSKGGICHACHHEW
jgi:hypothetical protein